MSWENGTEYDEKLELNIYKEHLITQIAGY
jgi:hypothetical protein